MPRRPNRPAHMTRRSDDGCRFLTRAGSPPHRHPHHRRRRRSLADRRTHPVRPRRRGHPHRSPRWIAGAPRRRVRGRRQPHLRPEEPGQAPRHRRRHQRPGSRRLPAPRGIRRCRHPRRIGVDLGRSRAVGGDHARGEPSTRRRGDERLRQLRRPLLVARDAGRARGVQHRTVPVGAARRRRAAAAAGVPGVRVRGDPSGVGWCCWSWRMCAPPARATSPTSRCRRR